MPTTERGIAPRKPHCSFCAKPAKEVGKLIAGAGVYICDACVGTCNDILGGTIEPRTTPPIGILANQTDEEILESLPRVAVVSDQADAHIQKLVDLLRSRGVSWARIGKAFGVTRQSAWEKYSNEE
ncbi:MAG TPA: ClpX C4-type zinc finger protein [Pseudonocardiaceae bacterium]|nr:ClpX C4-type zinc finger protein [Pseudonocardiaceae bacterium]